jgi:hypothetical protein
MRSVVRHEEHDEMEMTFLKEKIPKDGVGTHLGIDGDNAPSDLYIAHVRDIDVVDALVDNVKVIVHFLEPAPPSEVLQEGRVFPMTGSKY